MMSDKLIDSHLIGKSQFRSSHSFPVAEDRGGFRSIYGDVCFQQLLQTGKAVGTVRSFYVFLVAFVMAECFRLIMVGTDNLLSVSREISGVFYAIVVGLATGMGYLAYAAMITVIVGAVMLVSYKVVGHAGVQQHLLRIVISEDLDYEGVFEDILQKYTKTARLIQVKTINMGSMYELRYEIALAKDALVKEMIDDIRTRNANLTVSCSRVLTSREEL